MREISACELVERVKSACIEACTELPGDVLQALEDALSVEESDIGRDVLRQILKNARIAQAERVPICQDTGVTVVFVEVGQDARIAGGDLYMAINEGVRLGYDEGYLRKSIVAHPLVRSNTGTNTPAVIHTTIVPGDRITVTVFPKGGGSENMSAVKMLNPSDGEDGVVGFVVDAVRNAGSNPCPPVIVGVGLGGTLETAALLSKKALLRRVGSASLEPVDARLERRLLTAVNETGIGPAGLGGRVTALAVHVESYPCHIASLPVAVTLQCHAARHASFTI
ncbi:MAG: fumarate hydratase [Armatimonadota bacterium]